jgi:hypothetical protein
MLLGMCVGGRCSPACPLGYSDCNGDGSCECMGTCSSSGGGPSACVTMEPPCPMGCPLGASCCADLSSPDYGLCFRPGDVCLGGACCAPGTSG